MTCNPPPVDTDEDWLAFCPKSNRVDDGLTQMEFVEVLLQGNGWKCESENYDGDFFHSWRKGRVNVLLTDDHGWYERHRVATSVCKKLNIMSKEHRIAVFRAILYNEEAK